MTKKSIRCLATLLLVILTGCGLPSQKSFVNSLHHDGLHPIIYSYMSNRPLDQRSWVAVCKDSSGKEYIVTVLANGSKKTIELGENGRLTYEQMKQRIVKLGYGINAANNLWLYLAESDSKLYWRCPPYFFNLDGIELTLAQRGKLK